MTKTEPLHRQLRQAIMDSGLSSAEARTVRAFGQPRLNTAPSEASPKNERQAIRIKAKIQTLSVQPITGGSPEAKAILENELAKINQDITQIKSLQLEGHFECMNIRTNTVDRFQGMEKPIIILMSPPRKSLPSMSHTPKNL